MKTSNKHLNYKAKGFTLVELLVVIGIIATLGGLSYGPILKQIRYANVTKATKVCNDMLIAINNFELEYGSLPSGESSYPTTDQLVETDDNVFLDVIMGFDTDNNDKGKKYFDADQADAVASGGTSIDGLEVGTDGSPEQLTDKWGNSYSILLDYDGDGEISLDLLTIESGTRAYEENLIRYTETAVVLSPGRDGLFDDIEDSTSF